MVDSKIVVGLVGGVGADLDALERELKMSFGRFQYSENLVIKIKISDMFDSFEIDESFFSKHSKDSYGNLNVTSGSFKQQGSVERYHAAITIGNLLRYNYDDNSILAKFAVAKIYVDTIKKINDRNHGESKIIYIIDQIKTIEEFKILRKVYGRSFFAIGAFHDEKKRMKRLKLRFNKEDQEDNIKKLIARDKDEGLVTIDGKKYDCGQKVSKVFPECHLFVDVGNVDLMKNQIERFVNMLFGYPHHTPSIDESCMFLAKGVAARSADLGRQVGAVIADESGNIISIGSNEVPKVGGGFYVEGDSPDLRDFKMGYDANKIELKKMIKSILDELEKKIEVPFSTKNTISDKINDLLEFGRSVHAEQAAICDAAKRGVSLHNCVLYCTTFPCHMCAKHIMAVGIKRVVYVDPYPKNKVFELFEDSISLNQEYFDSNKLDFEPFIGIAPRRFMHFFIRNPSRELREKSGVLKEWPSKVISENIISHLRNRSYATFIFREISIIFKLKTLQKNMIKKNSDMSNILRTKSDIGFFEKCIKKLDVYQEKFEPLQKDSDHD